jgi:MFS family permease
LLPRSRWPAILYCLLSWAGAFYHLILFSFLKRDIQAGLGISPATMGWIDGVTFAAAALGGLVLGRAADLGARRFVLALAPVLPAAGSLWLSHADGIGAAFAARIVVGFGVGAGWGVGHAVIAGLYEGSKRLRAAAILQTGGPVGVIAAALAGCVLIPGDADGWRTVLVWSSLTAAIALLDPWAMGRLSPRPPVSAAPGPPVIDAVSSPKDAACRTAGFSRLDSERDRGRRGGRDLPASVGPQWGSSVPPHVGPAKAGGPGQSASSTGPVQSAARPPLPSAAYGIFGLLVLQMTAYWCTFAWLPSHLLGQGASRSTVGWIQVATGVTQGFADLLFGWLSPRVGVRRLFALCNVAFGAGVIAFAAAFPAISSNAVALAATVAAIGLGSGSWAAFGPLFAEHVPASIRGSVSSTAYHLARASQLVVHPLVLALGTSAASQAPSLLLAASAAWIGAAAIRALPAGRLR